MASILISRSMIRIFSGFKHFLAPRYDLTRIPKLQPSIVNLCIARPVQRTVEITPTATQKLDQVFLQLDSKIRRTGRISRKEVDDVFGELKGLKSATGTQSLLLLRCLGSLLTEELPEVRNKLVQEIWDTLVKFNVPLDISHYNALLKVYIENDHDFSPFEFLSGLEKAGMEPNRVTYQRLISRYCNLGDIEGACKILEFMKEKQLHVSEGVFNSLIIGHARANDMENAHGILGVMKSSGLTPSVDTYMNLLIGYAEKGDLEGIKKVEEECQSSDEQLQNREYMEVIYALASKGHSQHVSIFMEKLEKVFGYQQDTMNLIYRLINAGCDEVAYQMFETMVSPQNIEGDTMPMGNFFLKQLVKSELYSVVTVIRYCQKMKREGLNMYAMEKSLLFALEKERPELAIAIMRVILEDGGSIRSHYFWPIMIHYANRGEKEMLYKVVEDMLSLGVPITLETCRDYLMPVVLGKDADEEPVIMELKKAGMAVPNVINGCVYYYLTENDIVSAAQLLSRYKVRVTSVMRRNLSDAYIKSKEAVAAAAVLRQMITDIAKKEASAETSEVTEEGQASPETTEASEEVQEDDVASPGASTDDIGGLFLLDVVMRSRAFPDDLVLPLLKAMKTQGISISRETSASVQERLGEKMTQEVVDLLEDLSSGDLTLQPLSQNTKPLAQHSVEELEHRLTELEIKDQPRTYVLGNLLGNYARMRDVQKAEEVKQKLEAQEYPLTAGQYVLLIEMYAQCNQLEKAMDLYQQLKQKEPDTVMNVNKVLRIASAMISNGMLEETLKLIQENAIEESREERNDPVMALTCGRLLSSVVGISGGTPQYLQQLYDVLTRSNFTKPSSATMGPLIRVHLANDDLSSAMETFERICQEHKLTPAKHELTLACIKTEDTEKLQKIVDLSMPLHGEMNSLYDLVFAFIECDKVRQAKKVLETPGLRARHQRLETHCKRLVDGGRVTELEHLVSITKGVFDIDRNMMFMHLLEAYRRQRAVDKAYDIWVTMQEENIEPSEAFLWELGQLLKKNDREVPFVMPTREVLPKELDPPADAAENAPPVQREPAQVRVTTSHKAEFLHAMREKNFTAALEMKKRLESSGTQLSVTDTSKLIWGLLSTNQVEEANQLAREMVANGVHPLPGSFKLLFNRLSQNGDIDGIRFFENNLNMSLKKTLSYDNCLCNAYMKAGRSEEVLDLIAARVEGSEIDVADVRTKFPMGGILSILENNKDFVPKVMTIAENYSRHGITNAANTLWAYHFLQGSYTEAKEVYDKYLANSEDPLLFRSIINKARATGNTELLAPLIEVLNSKPNASASSKGIVYSCWLDVLCADNKFDEALGVLEGSLKSVSLDNYNATALVRLRQGLTSSDKTFPYTIPEKKAKDVQQSSSSSSSSSDSDTEKKS